MIQTAQDVLATTLANSAAFRTFVGAANVNAALERIHHDSLPDPADDTYTPEELESIRPCAMIYTLPDAGFHYDRDAAGTNNWAARGELVCLLFRDYPTEENDQGEQVPIAKTDGDTGFREIAGDILADLVDMSEQGDRLAITGFTCSGPYRTEPDELQQLGDRQAFEILIRWGNR